MNQLSLIDEVKRSCHSTMVMLVSCCNVGNDLQVLLKNTPNTLDTRYTQSSKYIKYIEIHWIH